MLTALYHKAQRNSQYGGNYSHLSDSLFLLEKFKPNPSWQLLHNNAKIQALKAFKYAVLGGNFMAFSIKLDDESDVENTSYLQNNKLEIKKLLKWIQNMDKKAYLILSNSQSPGRKVKINQEVCSIVKKPIHQLLEEIESQGFKLTVQEGEGSAGGKRKPYNLGDVKEALFAIALFLRKVWGKNPKVKDIEEFIDNKLPKNLTKGKPIEYVETCPKGHKIKLSITLASSNYDGVKIERLKKEWKEIAIKEREFALKSIQKFLEGFKKVEFTEVIADGLSNQKKKKEDVCLKEGGNEVMLFSIKGGHGQFSQMGGISYLTNLDNDTKEKFFEAFIEKDVVKKELEKIKQPKNSNVKRNYVEYVKKVYESMCGELNKAFNINGYFQHLSDSLVELSTRGKELVILDISNGVQQIDYKQIKQKLAGKTHEFSAKYELSKPTSSQGLPIPKITISCKVNGKNYNIIRLRFKVEWAGDVKRNYVEVLSGYFKMIDEI